MERTGSDSHKMTATDHYSSTTYGNKPSLNSISEEDDKKPVEYEMPEVEEENVYEDPNECFAAKGFGYCNVTYEDMVPREGEGIETVYCDAD